MRFVQERVPSEGSWTVAEVQEKAFAELAEIEPDLFQEAITEHAAAAVRSDLQHLQASHRRSLRLNVFARFAEGEVASDSVREDLYGLIYAIDEQNTWKRLGDMLPPDLRYAAGERRRQETAVRLEAEFLEALERKTRRTGKPVSEVIPPDVLQGICESIYGKGKP